MIDARSLITMDSEQAVKLAQASEAKAKELEAAVEVIGSRFAGQKRISLDTVLNALKASAQEYREAATPEFWTNPPAAPAVETPAEVTPDANTDATEAVAETPEGETPAKGRRR